MKSFAWGRGAKGRRPDSRDNNWEVAKEIVPDPFSDEEHTRLHTRRFSRNSIENKGNLNNREKP